MSKDLSYFRIKTTWIAEAEDSSLVKVKTEELALASSYTEAEKVAYALIDDQQRTKFGDAEIEIVKAKITEVLYNDNLLHDEKLIGGLVYNYFEDDDTQIGIYNVKVVFITTDEKGKEKKSAETIFVPAKSNTDAANLVNAYLKKGLADYVIRDVKFDKAEAVLWPTGTQQSKMNAYQ